MPISMASSPSSPICLPECRTPVLALPVLHIMTAVAIGCLFMSDLTLLWRHVLFGAVILEFLHAFHRIRNFRRFTLDRDDKGRFRLNEGCGPLPISGLCWRDFGCLAVLHYRRDGRARSAVWWLLPMPEPQRRQLRLWMNVPATAEANELPSILVNPVL